MSVETIAGFGPVILRAIRPEDGPALVRYFERLTPEDIRLRFFAPMRSLTSRQLDRAIHIDHDREMALVLEAPGEADPAELWSVGRLAVESGSSTRMEFAISVRSDLKGRGLGRFMLAHLIERARQRGIGEIFGDILEENTGMLALARELGFTLAPVPESSSIIRAALKFQRS